MPELSPVETFVMELLLHYTSMNSAMYAGSLLSHSDHILGSNSIITWNLCHTIAYWYIDIHHAELLLHYWVQ